MCSYAGYALSDMATSDMSLTLPPESPGIDSDNNSSPRRAVSPLLEVRRPHCTLNCDNCNAILEDRFKHLSNSSNCMLSVHNNFTRCFYFLCFCMLYFTQCFTHTLLFDPKSLHFRSNPTNATKRQNLRQLLNFRRSINFFVGSQYLVLI